MADHNELGKQGELLARNRLTELGYQILRANWRFEKYEVDSVCTPEGIFAIPTDEGHESFPIQMIDAIKECLQEVYNEGNVDRAPLWKQIEVATSTSVNQSHMNDEASTECVNFQRKIIPIDELNFEKLHNGGVNPAAGVEWQQLQSIRIESGFESML